MSRRVIVAGLILAVAAVALGGMVLAVAPQHQAEALFGSRVALAADLIATAHRRTRARTCVVVGDSRAAALGTWASDCSVENVAQYGSTTFIWRDVLPLLDVTIPEGARIALWLGVNDLRQDPRADMRRTAHNLIEIIQKLASRKRKVWVLPQIPVHFGAPEEQRSFDVTIRHIEQQLHARFDDDDRVAFVDLSPVVGTIDAPIRDAYADPVHLEEAASMAVRDRLDAAWRARPPAP